MYIIKRNSKRFNSKTFKTYEEARSYIRKLIRKYLNFMNMKNKTGDHSCIIHRNPSINQYGYTVTCK